MHEQGALHRRETGDRKPEKNRIESDVPNQVENENSPTIAMKPAAPALNNGRYHAGADERREPERTDERSETLRRHHDPDPDRIEAEHLLPR